MTLSRDRTLRLWPISEQLSSDLGAESGQEDEAGDFEVASMETSFASSQMELDMSFTPQVQLYMYIIHVTCTYSTYIYNVHEYSTLLFAWY